MYRFGAYQLEPATHELRKSGIRVKIQEQPFVVLLKLLERPGELVTREELRLAIWPSDTFVDFDTGLNTIIMRLREVLRDSAEVPQFIETVPKLGYRFVAPVESFKREQSSKGRGRTKNYVPILFAVAAITVGMLAVWKIAHRTLDAPRVLRFTALTNDGQAKSGPMATDGSRIYFNEDSPGLRSRILQVSVKGGEAVPFSVPLKQPAVLDLSVDGTELLIGSEDGLETISLWLLPVAGGSPRRIGTILAVDARFGADGTSIIYGSGHDIYSNGLDGASPRKLLTVDNTPFSFRFSPDAMAFRFTQFDYLVDSMSIMQADADGAGLHKMFGGCCGTWTSDGRFFIFQSRSAEQRLELWAWPEEKRFRWWKRDDKPIPLTAGPLNFQYPLLSRDGKEIFAIGGSRRAEVIRYDSRSLQFVPYLAGISAEGLAFSRDGKWVTYASFPEGTLWRSKMDGSERLQLTFPPLRVLLPRWSPDGKQIAFNATLPGVISGVYLISSEGGTPQRVLPSEQSQTDVNWSPDGNSLAFGTLSESNMPIYIVDLRSKRVSALPGSNGFFSPRWSPDGRYIAAITTETLKLMLFDFATQKWAEVFGSEIGYLWWSHEGKYIYFQDKRNSVQGARNLVVRLRLSDRKIENIVDVDKVGRLTTGTIVDWFGLAPDDSPIFARDISTSEIYALEMNWP